MASPAWRPQEDGLREICGLLDRQLAPTSADKSIYWQRLQHYSHFPDFNNYLAFIFAHPQGISVEVRQAAGLLLKNNLRSAFNTIPPANQQYIKSELLPCMGASDRQIRSTSGTIISTFVQIGGVAEWPELLHALVKCLDSNDVNHMEGAMDALSKICEDVPQILDSDIPGLSERPINAFIPRFLQLFQSPNATLRKLSLGSVNQFIMLMPKVLFESMDKYLQGLFALANDPAPEVRKLVCAAFIQLIEVRPAFLEPHMRNLIEYMLLVNKDPDEEVALEAFEFWSAYCEAELPPENLREFLPRLIPILLSNMVYADDDESLVEAEEHGSLPDQHQDLKPRFHSSRFHGSEDVEDEDEDIVNVWNLRKCSAAALDFLSNVFGDDILPTLMPIVQANMSATGDEAWKDREAAVLALGGVTGEGSMYPHRSQVILSHIILINLLVACVEQIGSKNIVSINHCLARLGELASPRGSPIHRLIAYFTEALALRVARVWPQVFHITTPRDLDRVDDDNGTALRLLNLVSPIPKFIYFTSNEILFRVFEGKDRVHIIDFDTKQGLQWPSLFQSLSSRPHPPSHVRITGIGESKQELMETGDRLARFAETFNLPFEFHPVVDRLEDVRLWMLHVKERETVAVNCVFQLHKMLYDTSGRTLRDFLGLIRSTNAEVMVMAEQESAHNEVTLEARLFNSLKYYSAIFDSVDSSLPLESPGRVKIEEMFGREIRNIMAFEGRDRLERHEIFGKWQELIEQGGFQCIGIKEREVVQAEMMLKMYGNERYRVVKKEEENGGSCLILSWLDQPLYSVSAWTPVDSAGGSSLYIPRS